jgi:hypothetical protein
MARVRGGEDRVSESLYDTVAERGLPPGAWRWGSRCSLSRQGVCTSFDCRRPSRPEASHGSTAII